jgi:hypothetical protein
MKIRWRPSPDEERWLAVASGVGENVPPSTLAERAGGWRVTGRLARIALFVLGLVAAAMVLGIFGFDSEITLLVAGLVTALVAEWLTITKRLHASGIEEGLCVAGYFLIGLWTTTLFDSGPDFTGGSADTLVLIATVGIAGLRLLNPFVTTCAVLAFAYWTDSTTAARTLDHVIGNGLTTFIFGCSLAALALVLGAREYRRPSHDRMLDWLVATLPVATYVQRAPWNAHEILYATGSPGTGRLATVVLLLALAAAMLFAGLRRRRHAPLIGFMGCVACLAVELRLATSLATETWLILYGLFALLAGVALDRYLRQPRNGVTSVALSQREGPFDLLQTAGAAVLAQRSSPEPTRAEPAVAAGEGRFGGGGASGSF